MDVNPNPVSNPRSHNRNVAKRNAKMNEKAQERERDNRNTIGTKSNSVAEKRELQKTKTSMKTLAGKIGGAGPSDQHQV